MWKQSPIVQVVLLIMLIIVILLAATSGEPALYAKKTVWEQNRDARTINMWNRLDIVAPGGDKVKIIYFMNEDNIILCLRNYYNRGPILLSIIHETETLVERDDGPRYKSSVCCWSKIEYLDGRFGRKLHKNTWTWKIGDNGNVKTTMFRDLVEAGQTFFILQTDNSDIITTFSYDPEILKDNFKWLLGKDIFKEIKNIPK